jgi:hypothetical protein
MTLTLWRALSQLESGSRAGSGPVEMGNIKKNAVERQSLQLHLPISKVDEPGNRLNNSACNPIGGGIDCPGLNKRDGAKRHQQNKSME